VEEAGGGGEGARGVRVSVGVAVLMLTLLVLFCRRRVAGGGGGLEGGRKGVGRVPWLFMGFECLFVGLWTLIRGGMPIYEPWRDRTSGLLNRTSATKPRRAYHQDAVHAHPDGRDPESGHASL
jgi:hypothetical protein